MFDRWKKTHKAVYEVESENLAVPEVHIREDDAAAHDTKKPEAENISWQLLLRRGKLLPGQTRR